MSDFALLPLHKLLNPHNPMSRIETMERSRARPSARVGQLSQMGQQTGNFIVDGDIVVMDRATGQPVIKLDDVGITIVNLNDSADPFLLLQDSSGETVGAIFTNTSGNLELFASRLAAGERKLVLRAQSDNATQIATIELVADSSGGGTDGITISSDLNSLVGTTAVYGDTVLNAGNTDNNTRIAGDTNPNVLVVDAGNDRVEFQNSTGTAVHIIDAANTTWFNEPGNDLDLVWKDDANTQAFKLDAGLSRVLIHGQALGETLGAFLNSVTIPASTTYHACPFKLGADAVTNSFPIPQAGTLANLAVRISVAQPASGSLVCTLYVNNVASALTVTIPAGAAAPSNHVDSTNTVALAANDILRWVFVNNATAASATLTAVTTLLIK
jgi:hypothetical protein